VPQRNLTPEAISFPRLRRKPAVREFPTEQIESDRGSPQGRRRNRVKQKFGSPSGSGSVFGPRYHSESDWLRVNTEYLQSWVEAFVRQPSGSLEVSSYLLAWLQAAGDDGMGIIAQAGFDFALRKTIFRFNLDEALSLFVHHRAQGHDYGLLFRTFQ
jgi:hypothetical protein